MGTLPFAAFNGHVDAARVLVKELDADANVRNNAGDTPYSRPSDAVRLLKELGADVDVANHDGYTPLHFSERSCRTCAGEGARCRR